MGQLKSYGEPMPAQFAAGPYPFLQDQTWSAHSASVQTGYQRGSRNMHVGMKAPLPSVQRASKTLPVAHEPCSNLNKMPRNGNYTGYAHSDAEVMRSLANQQIPWLPEHQFHGTADLSALMRGNLDARAEPAVFVPPPPSPIVPPAAT